MTPKESNSLTFNEKYYSVDLQFCKNQIAKIIEMQSKTLEYLITFLTSTNDVKQLESCECFIHLVGKIRFNIESINTVMESFLRDDYRFKTSINVLYRSIIDDLTNIKYLLSFINFAEDDKRSLNNELNILHKEHLISMIEGIRAEKEFKKFLDEIQGREHIDEHLNAIDKIFQSNSEVVEDANTELWKKNSDIRLTTATPLANLLEPDGSRTRFISEKTKLKFIKKSNISSINELTMLFKYYSQYQHYSPKSNEYVNSHIEGDIYFYMVSINEITLTLNLLMNVLNFKDRLLIEEYDKHMQEYLTDAVEILTN